MSGSTPGHARSHRAERVALPLLGGLTALLLVVLLYYPVGTVLAEAFAPEGSVSLAPVLDVLADPFYHDLFAFTAWQAFLSTLASLALGLPGAYALARFEFRGRETLQSLTAVPFVLPSIMVAVGFVATFGREGPVNDLLRFLGLPTVDLVFTLPLVVVAHAFYNAPLVTRIVAAAWESVDGRAVETARSLGASPRKAFLDVVAPQLYAAVLTSALLTFIFTFMSFPIVLALGGFELATVEVWLYAKVQNLELTEAAALAVLETVVSLALTYGYLRYERAQARGARTVSPLPRQSLRVLDAKRLALLLYAGVVVVVFALPILSMLVASVQGPDGLTLDYYAFLLRRQTTGLAFQTKPLPAVRNTLLFGVGTLLLAVPMGIVLALASNREGPLARLLGTAVMLPFAVSGVVIGIGLLEGLVFGIELFGTRLRVGGPLAIVAAHAVAAYPFVVRNVAPLLADLDRAFSESARALGATRVRALVDVELPLIAPGIAAGAAFAFAISVGEFDSTIILAEGSSAYTIPIAVERYLTDRTLGPATAMGTILLVVTAGSFVVIDRLGGAYRG
ncbi:ABC transporter permease [Natronomonas sp. EA1]|uniref:ABC transporter permease n=1 Tax=Natronomonas sp. EA1 TaxID=3421655 RepID=UPI003EBBF5CB